MRPACCKCSATSMSPICCRVSPRRRSCCIAAATPPARSSRGLCSRAASPMPGSLRSKAATTSSWRTSRHGRASWTRSALFWMRTAVPSPPSPDFIVVTPPASRGAQAALSDTGNNGSPTRAERPREAPMREIGHFIGGKKVAGTSGRSRGVFNPNTGEGQANDNFPKKSEVEAAIANAEAAQPAWAATNPQRRARVLFKFLKLVQNEFDSLAQLLSSEHGKTVADSKGDIQRGLEVVEFACGIPHLLKG